MVWIFSLSFFCSFSILAATHIQSSLFAIDYAQGNEKDTLLLLNSGHVLKVPKHATEVIDQLTTSLGKDDSIHFISDEKSHLISAQLTNSLNFLKTKRLAPHQSLVSTTENYVPTTVESMNTARKYFYEARYNPKESQCFNRAMVWTHEWWRNHSLRSNKILIFFTRNYIRRYSFEWWFHIAPYVHVMENGKVVERVLDVKYGNGPMSFRNWTNIFMKLDPECPVIEKFSDYADHPYEGECFLQRTNMYTYQPADLQMSEAWGYSKSNFDWQEVKQAYLDAMSEDVLVDGQE